MKQPKRILLADDDEGFRESTASFLRQCGYECVCAPDAANALRLVAESAFDLLISDLEMPGNHDLAMIRELPRVAAGLPVILLTGHPTIDSAVLSVRLPVIAYLVKPPDPAELQALVDQAVTRRGTYEAVHANRQRLQKWSQDLAQLEELLLQPRSSPEGASANDFLNLTFHNLTLTLVDLRQMIQALAQQEGKTDTLSELSLIDALRETIGVLAKTRQSFKSKELGELRRKLEELIQIRNGQ